MLSLGILAGDLGVSRFSRGGLGGQVWRGRAGRCDSSRGGMIFMLEPQDFGEFLVVALEELEGSESLAGCDTIRSAHTSATVRIERDPRLTSWSELF